MREAKKAKFILIDHSIIDNSGHYLEYAKNVIIDVQKRNYDTWLIANYKFSEKLSFCNILAMYKYDVWGKKETAKTWVHYNTSNEENKRKRYLLLESGMQFVKKKVKMIYNVVSKPIIIRAFSSVTIKALNIIKPSKNDIIFLPTVSVNDLSAIYKVLNQNRNDIAQHCTWHIVLRRNIYKRIENKNTLDTNEALKLKKILERFCKHTNVYFYTDTEELTQEYNSLDVVEFTTLPIPINHEIMPFAYVPKKELNVAYLGDARSEKGFQHLPMIIKRLNDKHNYTNLIKFTVQANFGFKSIKGNEKIVETKKLLNKCNNINLSIIDTALSSREYCELLKNVDIALFPYEKENYYSRSSGIFAECLAAGIPVIAPTGTWMARQIEKKIRIYQNDLLKTDLKKEVIYEEKFVNNQLNINKLEIKNKVDGISIEFNNKKIDYINVFLKFYKENKQFLSKRHFQYECKEDLDEMPPIIRIPRDTTLLNIEVNSINDIKISSVVGISDLPISIIGSLYNEMPEIIDSIDEVIRYYDHYRRTAMKFSNNWRKLNCGNNILNIIEENIKEIEE